MKNWTTLAIMKKRVLASLLILAVLCTAFPFVQPVKAVDSENKLKVVYIPLDNRPFNDERVQLMAESLDIELIMPEEALYSTKLDGQTLNPNGTQYGDRGSLFAWLKKQAKEYDTFIISMDQLLSGGLMNSRCMTEMSKIQVQGSASVTEYQIIDYIKELAKTKTVYVIDSVLRLAVSCDYGGYDLNDYTITRKYGLVDRPVLTGNDLTLENVLSNYRLSTEGEAAYLQADFSQEQLDTLLSPLGASKEMNVTEDMIQAYTMGQDIPDEVENVWFASAAYIPEESENSLLSTYLAARERKLRLVEYGLRTLGSMANVHYLLGVDDSSEGNNIQTNEIALLSQYLGDGDQIFSALDGLAQAALEQIFSQAYGNETVQVSVTYFGENVNSVGSFNYLDVQNMVSQTLDYFNGTIVEDQPDISVLVLTDSNDTEQRDYSVYQLINQLNENEAQQLPTILLDMTTTQKAATLRLLGENIHMGMLLAYSGSQEIPNQVVMGLSQGIARYASLVSGSALSQSAQVSHLKNLYSCLVKEYYKAGGGAAEMLNYLSSQGYSSNLGKLTSSELATINKKLKEQVTSYSETVTESFRSSNFIVSLKPYTLSGITDATVTHCSFPWLRQSEIDCDTSCSYQDEPYELGEFHQSYVSGVSTSYFCPDEPLTRSQAAKLLILASQTAVGDAQACPFQDVPTWAEAYVTTAYQTGYLKGYGQTIFRGDQNMTRAEFAAMLMQYLEAENLTLEQICSAKLSDVARDGDTWYAAQVYYLADAGVISGYEDSTFRPERTISRGEAVLLLNRFFGRNETLSDGLQLVERFSDVTSDNWLYPAIHEASISHFCSVQE